MLIETKLGAGTFYLAASRCKRTFLRRQGQTMVSPVLRYKLRVVASVTIFFVAFTLIVGVMIDAPMDVVVIIGAGTGFLIGAFEEFYFQGRPGAWMRKMRPILAVPVYACIVCVFCKHPARDAVTRP